MIPRYLEQMFFHALVSSINLPQLAQLLNNQANSPVVIDVRDADELRKLVCCPMPADIVLYCRSSHRSYFGAGLLIIFLVFGFCD